MADEIVFLAHRCGYAVCLGKQLGNDWRFNADAANTLAEWLISTNPPGFWDAYNRDAEVDPWVVLHEGMGDKRGFNVTWSTPSGSLFCDADYITGSKSTSPIFKFHFIEKQ